MSKRPAPLVPAECNMAGNDWFPLYFGRLRKSKWWRRASDMARARNVMLWGEAYQATPAGSLPDDDDDLAEAAGFGMDVASFLAAKAEIMAPWVLCSDGRWYHPTTCEMVLDAWSKTSERRKKEAIKKAAQRARVRSNDAAPRSDVPAEIANVPGDNAENVPLSLGVSAQTEQTGEDRQKIQDADASLSPEGDEHRSKEYPDLFEDAWKAYPHVKGRSSKLKSLGIWRRLPQARRAQLSAAAARFARDGREPKAECGSPGMHRWLSDQKFLDWMEPDAPASAASSPAILFPGPAALRQAVFAHDADLCLTYLDHSGWLDLPTPTILVRNEFVASKLKPFRAIFLDFGVSVVVEPKADRSAA